MKRRLLATMLSACIALSLMPTAAFAEGKAQVDVPAPGSTIGQPFSKGTAGSSNFRIPSLVTLDNGDLFAAIDARWNHSGDACSLDTLISISPDNGETWNYSFANYFNDSNDTKQSNATAFIDPVTVVGKDGAIYIMTDMFPGGIGLNTAPKQPAKSTGYEKIDGQLRMVIYDVVNSQQTNDNYIGYVGDFADGYAPIYDLNKNVLGYVDEYYYLYTSEKEAKYCPQLGNANKEVQQNVFFYNADYHVRGCTFLWLIKSTDNGKTWSAPNILNPMILDQENPVNFYGVGPGAGLCLEDGTLMLPCYTFVVGAANSGQIASFIYSVDEGKTWTRSEDATDSSHWSSESALVQIDDTTVRHFYRDGIKTLYYTDHILENGKWVASEPVNVGVTKTTNNQLSAINYSKLINGKPAIMVSTAASGSSSRQNGMIYTFTVNEDKTMDLVNSFNVTTGSYSYSSLTEMANGDIALLYEGSSIQFATYSIDDVIGNDAEVIGDRAVDVPLYGESAVFANMNRPTQESLDAAVASGIVSVAMDGDDRYVFSGLKDGVVTMETICGYTFTLTVAPKELVEIIMKEGESQTIELTKGEITHEADADIADVALAREVVREAAPGTSKTAFNSACVSLDKALYHFTGDNENGFTVSGTMSNGTQVYMDLSTSRKNSPNTTNADAKMFLVDGYTDSTKDAFYLTDNNGKYWYFYRNNSQYQFEVISVLDGYENTNAFLLYRPANEGETSSEELPGYIQVTPETGVTEGDYLIAAKVDADYYLLYPSNNKNGYTHVAKAVDTITASIEITGISAGITDVMVDGVVYRITVLETQAPSTPTKVAVQHVYNYGGIVTWNASSDNVGVVKYEVHCNEQVYTVTELEKLSVEIGDLESGKEYNVKVYAFDAVGNMSEAGSVTFTTTNNKGHEESKNPIDNGNGTHGEYDRGVNSGNNPGKGHQK